MMKLHPHHRIGGQAAGGNLSIDAITDTSFIVRSPTAEGVVCANPLSVYALDVSGVFNAGPADSVQILIAAETPSWRYLALQAVGTPGTIGPSNCMGPGAHPAMLGVRLVAPSR